MAVREIRGRLYLDFYTEDPQTGERRRFRRSLGSATTSRREAERIERELRVRLEVGYAPTQVTPAPFEDYARHWLDDVCGSRDLSPATLRSFEQQLGTHAVPHFGRRNLHELRVQDIDRFVTGLARGDGSALAPKTKVNVRSMLFRLFEDAVREGYADSNPVRGSYRPRVRKTYRRRWSPEEAVLFLETTRAQAPTLYPFFLLLLHTGLRLGEARALRWTDIDLDRGEIVVRRTASRNQERHTKSGHDRVVPLSPTLREALDALGPTGDASLVFRGTAVAFLPESPLRRAWARLTMEAGLPRMRIHDLRHTAASLLHASGASVVDVRDILGHASVEMTERYIHGITTAMRHASQRLPAPATTDG